MEDVSFKNFTETQVSSICIFHSPAFKRDRFFTKGGVLPISITQITRIIFFFDNIIWSDEAKFTKNGVFTRHNSHYWSDYNVHPFRERNFQESWQCNAYCAIRNDGVVALEFYQDNLNGERYLNILRNFEINYLDNLPLADYRNIYHQHDGAPPHNGYLINNHLQNLFYDQWIANNGPHL
ncbi:hypothetical protein NQ318_003127 [Aromia moschata]|uniref:Uncharacterized protein n=1 Tax=Aromia moschata TaxID=1265417 RepID=A0AAV8YU54_9CUCU|nr:hypothetical protein NQ318_003127 [Aromia moschata]